MIVRTAGPRSTRREATMDMLVAVAMVAIATASNLQTEPMQLSEFAALARPAPDAQVRYGPASSQSIDVFVPKGSGPHPVAILIHGGCWMNLPGAGREQLRHLGSELSKQGIAVWSIGYRRADEEGGGYPGTYRDVATAIDHLRSQAAKYNLDVGRTVVVGHSAGGHLALWAASRSQLATTSPFYDPAALQPATVVSLGGVGDLQSFSKLVPIHCGPQILDRLIARDQPDPYSHVSPAELPPPSMPVVMISGILDRLVPPYVADDYARTMRKKHGKEVRLVTVPDAGHFDLVAHHSAAWRIVSAQITEPLRQGSDK